jgi:hypothetical protein
MFKIGDVIIPKYESGGSFRVIEILNEHHMLVKSTYKNSDFIFVVNINYWNLDIISYRRTKIIKILGKLRNK